MIRGLECAAPRRGRLRLETDLLEMAVLPVSIPDRSLPRLRAGEYGYLATAIIVEPLDAPLIARSAILENLCRLRHATNSLPMPKLTPGAASAPGRKVKAWLT